MPADHYGIRGHYLRISFGMEAGYLRAGLDRIHELIGALA